MKRVELTRPDRNLLLALRQLRKTIKLYGLRRVDVCLTPSSADQKRAKNENQTTERRRNTDDD